MNRGPLIDNGTIASGYDRFSGSASTNELIELRRNTVDDLDRHDLI